MRDYQWGIRQRLLRPDLIVAFSSPLERKSFFLSCSVNIGIDSDAGLAGTLFDLLQSGLWSSAPPTILAKLRTSQALSENLAFQKVMVEIDIAGLVRLEEKIGSSTPRIIFSVERQSTDMIFELGSEYMDGRNGTSTVIRGRGNLSFLLEKGKA